ncbi:hypothetical protein BJY52DRAFT_1422923 [Lactarius psammicola]|nr:hypothetical protein BJY52DRAFT_1422923 [Lactarius psammicola]
MSCRPSSLRKWADLGHAFVKGGQTGKYTIMLIKTAHMSSIIVVLKWDKPCYEETKGNVTPFVHCAWFHVGGHTLGPGIACTSINKDKTTKSIGEPELQLAFAPQVHAILPTVQINEGDHERPAVMTPTPDSTFEIYIPVNSLAPTIGGIGICARTSYCCHVVVQMSANILMGQIFGIRFLMFEFSEVYIPQN